MKNPTTLLVVVAGVFLMTAMPAQGQQTEEEAIRAAVGHYLQGHATGDGSHHEQVFHPESKLFWVRDGALNQRTSAAYIAGAPGHPADDEDQRKRRIAMIDITGTTAVVNAAAVRQQPEPAFQEAKQAVDLSQAERIVAVGRGIKGEEHLDDVKRLAAALGAELAASRPICDAGWAHGWMETSGNCL